SSCKKRCLCDWISGLPDEILVSILDKLDSRTVVGTNLLSRPWSHLRRFVESFHFRVVLPNNYCWVRLGPMRQCFNTHKRHFVESLQYPNTPPLDGTVGYFDWLTAALLTLLVAKQPLVCFAFSISTYAIYRIWNLIMGVWDDVDFEHVRLKNVETYNFMGRDNEIDLARCLSFNQARLEEGGDHQLVPPTWPMAKTFSPRDGQFVLSKLLENVSLSAHVIFCHDQDSQSMKTEVISMASPA
ncbi:hypothetical protein ZWY2020_056048, partial [Hordeum vulgare]